MTDLFETEPRVLADQVHGDLTRKRDNPCASRGDWAACQAEAIPTAN